MTTRHVLWDAGASDGSAIRHTWQHAQASSVQLQWWNTHYDWGVSGCLLQQKPLSSCTIWIKVVSLNMVLRQWNPSASVLVVHRKAGIHWENTNIQSYRIGRTAHRHRLCYERSMHGGQRKNCRWQRTKNNLIKQTMLAGAVIHMLAGCMGRRNMD